MHTATNTQSQLPIPIPNLTPHLYSLGQYGGSGGRTPLRARAMASFPCRQLSCGLPTASSAIMIPNEYTSTEEVRKAPLLITWWRWKDGN